MKREFQKYEDLKEGGASPEQVYRSAEADGMEWLTRLIMLQSVFGCSLIEAKEFSIIADGEATSLSEHQEKLAEGLEKALKDP